MFLLQQVQLGVGASQNTFRFADLSRRSGPLLLQPAQGVQIPYRRFALGASFHQLRAQVQHLFLGAALFHCRHVCLRGFQLRLRASGLRPGVRSIQHHQELALLYEVAFLYQQTLHGG